MMAESEPRQRDRLAQVVRQLEQQAQGSSAMRGSAARRRDAVAGAPVPLRLMPPPYDDPEEHYTREIKAALVDAMIENSGPIALGADEWLTVAARDNVPRDPLIPTDTADYTLGHLPRERERPERVPRRTTDARGGPEESGDARVLTQLEPEPGTREPSATRCLIQ